MRSRVIATVLVLVVGAATFAGGGAEQAPDGPRPVQVWLPGETGMADLDLVRQTAAEYAGPIIGAYPHIEFVGWEQWADKKQLAIQAGEEFDISFTAAWDNFFNEVNRNAWLPLDDLIDEHAPAIRSTVGFFLEGPVVNGRLYAIPTVKEGAQSFQYIFVKEYVDKYDVPIDEIRSPDDLEPWLEMIRENEPDIIPYLAADVGVLTLSHTNAWESLGVGRDFYRDGDGRVRWVWHMEEMWELSRTMYEWLQAGYLPPDIEDIGNTEHGIHHFDTGDWFASATTSHPGKAGEMSGQYGYPIVGGGPAVQPTVSTDILLGSMMAISRTSEDPVAAIRVLDLVNNDRYLNNLLNYGIEGTHYTMADAERGVIELVDDSGYAPFMQWALQNQFLNYVTTDEDPDKWERYRAYNESARVLDTVGFIADLDPIRTQLAALSNAGTEYGDVLARGIVDPDSVREEFLATMEAAGVREVEAELQRQVDAFLATKE